MGDEREIKIFLYGYTGVGCNQLSNVVTSKEFEENPVAVINWSYKKRTFNINGKEYIVNIWNGPGQESMRNFLKLFLKNANIVIFVYDITFRQSFDELNEYINIAKKILNNNFIGAIVGNKKDLFLDKKVPDDEARKFAKEL